MSYVALCLQMSRYVYIMSRQVYKCRGFKIFSAVFVSALLHVLTLFGGRFPVAAASLRLSQRPDPRRSHGCWDAGCCVWACLDGLCRVMSGQVGVSRVKAGVIFFRPLLSVRFWVCQSVCGVDFRFRPPLCDFHRGQIHAGHTVVGAPDVVFGRVWTVYVGSSRRKSGQSGCFSFFRPLLSVRFCMC